MTIPVGVDIDSKKIRFIDEVDRGLKCNCICPSCSSLLLAKKGPLKADHFAHYKGKELNSCRETAIHLMAKKVILEAERIQLPNYSLDSECLHTLLAEPITTTRQYFNEMQAIFHQREEIYLPDLKIKPDILCKTLINSIETDLAIEIAVTHKVDDKKHEKIYNSTLLIFEIDLSHLTNEENISFESIKREILNKNRLHWVHFPQDTKKRLKDSLREICLTKVENYNSEVYSWYSDLSRSLETKSTLDLPYYIFKESYIEYNTPSQFKKGLTSKIPPPPKIGGKIKIIKVEKIDNGIIYLKLSYKESIYELPIRVKMKTGNPPTPTTSYLNVEMEGLLKVEQFEQMLKWGRSEKAEHYIKSIRDIISNHISEQKAYAEKVIRRKIEWLYRINNGEKPPRMKNIAMMETTVEHAKKELSSKGFNTSKIVTDIESGWIMGCPNEYWQILLFRAICVINNDGVTIDYYAKNLKEKHNIDIVDPARTLNFMKSCISHIKIDVDTDSIPNSFRVISDYLRYLCSINALKYTYKGRYKKMIPFGAEYRAIKNNHRAY